jgi:hypothetical protein
LIASRRAAGFGWVKAVRIPSPPAFETAATSSGTPTLDPMRAVRYEDRSARRLRRGIKTGAPLHATLHDGSTSVPRIVKSAMCETRTPQTNSQPDIQQLRKWRDDRHRSKSGKKEVWVGVKTVPGSFPSIYALMTWTTWRYKRKLLAENTRMPRSDRGGYNEPRRRDACDSLRGSRRSPKVILRQSDKPGP